MYSESELDAAVAAGVMPAAAAAAFRDYVAAQRQAPAVDEEGFRLLTGFNDIFVAIAIALLLVATGQIGGRLWPPLGGAAVAGASWALALFFTARRRMALPSILLLATFVGGIAAALLALAYIVAHDPGDRAAALIGAGIAAASAAGAWLHWRTFHVPITVAAGAVALAGVAIGLLLAVLPAAEAALWPLLLVAGLAVFALAMRWDLSDPERRTRRADVAFWLHLAAAPMIAHPLFRLLGVFSGEIGVATALAVLALYLAFAIVALAIDRRALLVSGLAYVLYAMYALATTAGVVELSAAFAGLAIGGALLSLSAFWQPMRRMVVGRLGTLADRLPPIATVPPAATR